jgi:SAM-dependent methyltransferase
VAGPRAASGRATSGPLDTARIDWLRTPAGERASVDALAALDDGRAPHTIQERLRRELPAEHASAALAVASARRTARERGLDGWERLVADRATVEQAAHPLLARHTAERFAGRRLIADLGCGAGLDTLALAERASRVLAVDRDVTRLAMLRANAAAAGVEARVWPLAADLEGWGPPPAIDAAWCDPARRDGAGRRLDPARWSPSLPRALALVAGLPAAGVKLAPGIDPAALPAAGELEFVSLAGRMLAAALWLGDLAGPPRRATVLGDEAGREAGVQTLAGEPAPAGPPAPEPARYLYDPDPAVGRAGLVGALAERLDARLLAPRIAYLTADARVDTPFARRFRVHGWLPFSERRLLARLDELGRELGAGRVDVMRRGSPIDTNALERRLGAALRASGAPADGRVLTVALTRVGGQPAAILCERERFAQLLGLPPLRDHAGVSGSLEAGAQPEG